METRRCARCKEDRPADDFYATGSYCKPCSREYARQRRAAPGYAEQMSLYNRDWNARNGPLKRLLDKRWVEENRERKLEINRKWQRNNPLGSGHRSRARRFGVLYTPIKKAAIFERDQWVCGLCGEPVDKDIAWPNLECATLDHIIPMSRGGDHVETNVQLAHFLCNLMKRDEYHEDDDEV
jgi:5-methylcytosine-specific restriction endonuclease McrA